MDEYVIGLDTGSTKSQLALFDMTGTLVDFCRWGPLNYENLPGLYVQFEDELGQFVNQVLTKNKITINQVSYSTFGIAGVDTRQQHTVISGILKKIGFKNFTLVNDAFLSILAGSPTGTGICANNGTGCTITGINKDGKMLQIGGTGFFSDDLGGGGKMGELVISAIYRELFRKGESTCMTKRLFEKLGMPGKYDFVEKMYEKIANGSINVASCSKMLFEATQENDKVAAKILRDVAANYADGISCMLDEIDFHQEKEVYIVLAGSVFVKSEHPLLLDSLKETVSKNNPGYRIKYVVLDVPPVTGAVIWALNTLHNKDAYYDKVCSEMRTRLIF